LRSRDYRSSFAVIAIRAGDDRRVLSGDSLRSGGAGNDRTLFAVFPILAWNRYCIGSIRAVTTGFSLLTRDGDRFAVFAIGSRDCDSRRALLAWDTALAGNDDGLAVLSIPARRPRSSRNSGRTGFAGEVLHSH
jgi:hypothetical protein